ncbi:MAG: translocase FtsK protein [Parcubacteria group bacterium GW2011_GWA1_38_7]|nr:MAG: translocase FtsK protein [Parcubacteria group bacterium GW2011_GWA1_38_7]
MAKKNNKKEDRKDTDFGLKKLKDETISWILAIIFFMLSIFFVLASFHKAGFVGTKVFDIFSKLFGYGYYLLPTVFFILGISFTNSIKRSFGATKFIGASLFFVSSLALLDFTFAQFGFIKKGGFVGNILQGPLVKLFDVYATPAMLISLIFISVLVIFDATINISSILNIFRKKKEGESDETEEKAVKILNSNEKTEEGYQGKIAPQITQGVDKRSLQTEGGDDFGVRKNIISFKPFPPPPLSLLERDRGKPEVGDIKANSNIIKRTLQNFGIIVEMDEISIGPSVTRYALKPAEGVKLSKILGLQNNLELALAAHPVRIEAPIPGKSLVGIEIPNSVKTMVGLGSILSQSGYTDSEKSLTIALGKSISGASIFANIAKMPHLLIAGATGSGKSVTIHVLINSLLFRNSAENLKFIMIDPKRVELTQYNKIPHLLTPVITDAKKVIMSLKWASKEMDRRYDILETNKVRDIESYHKNILSPALEKFKKNPPAGAGGGEVPELMPYIVIVIDELADIMQAYPRELESAIIRLAQMSRAVGIHLILSTQRPSVNVITGLIKANIPARIALQVASQFDSRTILDTAGAEKLLGAGDMLYISGEMSKPIRLQSPFISENEVKKVVEYLVKNAEDEIPTSIDMEADKSKNIVFESLVGGGESEDDLYEEAREIVIGAGKASTSYLQRKLRIGYARAARLMDILEENGVVGGGDGAKPRDVLIKPEGGFATDQNEEQENEHL